MGCTEEISRGLERLFVQGFLQHQIEDFVGYGTSCEHVQGEINGYPKDQLRLPKKWSTSTPRLLFEFTGSDFMSSIRTWFVGTHPTGTPVFKWLTLGESCLLKHLGETRLPVRPTFLSDPCKSWAKNCWHNPPSRCAHTWWNNHWKKHFKNMLQLKVI